MRAKHARRFQEESKARKKVSRRDGMLIALHVKQQVFLNLVLLCLLLFTCSAYKFALALLINLHLLCTRLTIFWCKGFSLESSTSWPRGRRNPFGWPFARKHGCTGHPSRAIVIANYPLLGTSFGSATSKLWVPINVLCIRMHGSYKFARSGLLRRTKKLLLVHPLKPSWSILCVHSITLYTGRTGRFLLLCCAVRAKHAIAYGTAQEESSVPQDNKIVASAYQAKDGSPSVPKSGLSKK